MAASIRGLFKLNAILPSNSLLRNTYINVGARFLYTERSLGLGGYESLRLSFRNQFMNVESAFRQKMEEVCKQENSMVFTEDLKAMLHLMQKKPEDLDLVVKMIEKFNAQNKELRFGTFVFGPVVMRAFYYLDEPEIAMSTFLNPDLTNFFSQFSSVQILMSLLYKHEKYNEIRNVYDVCRERSLGSIAQPKNVTILLFAGCYKQNTPEALEYSLQVWQELTQKGFRFLRRAITFLAALALKQDRTEVALEIISNIREPRYIDVRCMKLLIYSKLGRFDDMIPILRRSLEVDTIGNRKEVYFHDVIKTIEESLATVNADRNVEICKLLAILKQNDQINLNDTLENHLCSPIDVTRKLNQRNLTDNRYEMDRFPAQRQRSMSNNRPGLRDFL